VMDRELKLLYELLLRLGVTFILAAALFGVYMLMARKRAKKAPRSFFTISVVTLALYVLLILNESELFGRVKLWEGVYLWTKFAAYLGTAFLFLKAMDILLLEDYFIIKKGLYIPELLRLLILLGGLVVAGIIFLRTVIGINVVALVAIPTAATAVIGFALQDTLKRFFAGIMLGKLVRVGDWVRLAGQVGRVVKVDLGHVTILTPTDDLVMIPNNLVAQQEILNYNKPTPRHARTVLVDASYATPPLQVQTVLVETAKAVPGVLHEPAPQAFVAAYKDSSIQYRLTFWGKDYGHAGAIEGQVLSYVWYAFQRHSIEIPFPQRTIHITKVEDEREAMAAKRERILEALRRIDFLSVLSPEELETVAQLAAVRVYLPGEAVVRQGETGAEFFIILGGSAEVRRGEGDKVATVATLHAMQFFGEMSLLTGEPRSATVVAQTKLEVVVLTKAALEQPIMGNPLIAERIGTVLAERKSEIAALQENLEQRVESSEVVEHRRKSLGSRIRSFFGATAH
jgi:small-conductance mechanosensitive channel/CRP-like cAMP-binding protein